MTQEKELELLNRIESFYRNRFGMNPKTDKEYFDLWVKRILDNTAEKYADSETLKVLKEFNLL